MDQQTVLLEMYKECCVQGRHHETQRTSITTVCFAFAGAVLGFGTKSGVHREDLVWYLILVVLGALAAVLSYKQYERFRLAMERAGQYRRALDEALRLAPDAPLSIRHLKNVADKDHREKFAVFEKVHLHIVWTSFFALVSLTGALLVLVALRKG